MQGLLAVQVPTLIGRIEDRDYHFLRFSGLECPGNIERERVIAAAVAADIAAVDLDGGLPVDCSKVQEDALPAPSFRHAERAAVP